MVGVERDLRVNLSRPGFVVGVDDKGIDLNTFTRRPQHRQGAVGGAEAAALSLTHGRLQRITWRDAQRPELVGKPHRQRVWLGSQGHHAHGGSGHVGGQSRHAAHRATRHAARDVQRQQVPRARRLNAPEGGHEGDVQRVHHGGHRQPFTLALHAAPLGIDQAGLERVQRVNPAPLQGLGVGEAGDDFAHGIVVVDAQHAHTAQVAEVS